MRTRFKFIVLGSLLMLLSNAAIAATYTYTGVTYTSASGLYTTDMAINGSFETASPLPADMPLTEIGPGGSNLVTSWSFNDGVTTFTEANSMPLYGDSFYFSVATNSVGEITEWTMGFMSPLGPHAVAQPMDAIFFSSHQQATSAEPCSLVANDICTSIPTSGTNYADSSTAGTWEGAIAPATPVPSMSNYGIAVLILSLMFLAFRLRRT